MTEEEAKALKEETWPETVDGQTRPTEPITVDMPYSEELPQLFSGDFVGPDQPNTAYRQLLSNDKSLKDGTTPVAKATQADTANTCTGNSATATKLQTARTISLTGDVTGSASFDGSSDIAINVGLVGKIEWYAGNTTPAGYLLCDGSAISRTDYAELFDAIGTIYGTGDGSSTFNLPNLIDRVPWGSATVGTVKAAGLPNAKGELYSWPNGGGGVFMTANGAFELADQSTNGTIARDAATAGYNKVMFSLASSNSIYGSSTTVQPPALTLKPIIKYA